MLVVGAIVAAVISVAALVDPFSSLPPVGEIWEDCQEDYDTPGDDCELSTRFPGFWGNVIASFAYAVVGVGLLIWLAAAVTALRGARAHRFSSREAAEHYRHARATLTLVGGLLAALAVLPIVVAVA